MRQHKGPPNSERTPKVSGPAKAVARLGGKVDTAYNAKGDADVFAVANPSQ